MVIPILYILKMPTLKHNFYICRYVTILNILKIPTLDDNFHVTIPSLDCNSHIGYFKNTNIGNTKIGIGYSKNTNIGF